MSASLLFALGILIAGIGLRADALLPAAKPGLGLIQVLLSAAGLALCWGAIRMRRRNRIRLPAVRPLKIVTAAGIAGLTLLALEIVLSLAGAPAYYPVEIELTPVEAVPWWVCDGLGCHYDYEQALAACARGDNHGRHCVVNRQGFADSEDFAIGPDYGGRTRILVMGDSFTHGFTADVGKSYVETLEAALPDAIVWNAGITATGTSQALAAFEAFAPQLRPQLSVLGFYMNDFRDNLLAPGGGVHLQDSAGEQFFALRFQLDRWGKPFEVANDVNFAYVSQGYNPPRNDLERRLGKTRIGALTLQLLDSVAAPFRRAAIERRGPVTRQYLRGLRDAAATLGSQFLVLLIPKWSDIGGPGADYQLAITLLDELNIAYLNPLHLLHPADDYVNEIDIHWNNSGHQKAGQLLADCVKSFTASGGLSRCERIVIPAG